MSLVSGFPPQPYHTPGLSHDFYGYPHPAAPRFHPDPHRTPPDGNYVHNWVLNGGGDSMNMSPEGYGMHGTPSPPDYGHMGMFGMVTDENGIVRVRCVRRRNTANKKERRRTHSINSAFASLRGCIPNVLSDTKLSKIKTLRLATSYIAYLMDILNKDDPTLTETGFKAEISKKIESREEKRKREAVSI